MVRGDIIIVRDNGTQVTFKNCAPFINCITKIDGKTIDDAEDLDLVMSMYNFLEYSSNYSDTTGSLWFYSKGEANSFNANIVHNVAFKSSVYKTKLVGETEAQPAPNNNNGVLKTAKSAVSLKFLSNFRKSLEIPLINYNRIKVELKLKWINFCVLAAACIDNVNANDDNIIFTFKYTKLYVSVIILSKKDNQKLSKPLGKGFERSVYWNEYKTKSENRITTNEYRYFMNSNFAWNSRFSVLVYSNQDNSSEMCKALRYIYKKVLLRIVTSSLMEKTFMIERLFLVWNDMKK